MNRLRRDSGTTAVEFALIALLLLTIVMAGIDFGLWTFQKSEASQAAREASRVAMIHPPATGGVQPTTSAIYQAAVYELESSISGISVSATCYNGATVDSTCTPGQDVVTVTVSWHRTPLTFVGMSDQVSGSSTRTVVGVPSS